MGLVEGEEKTSKILWRDTRSGAGWNIVIGAAFVAMVAVVVAGTWWTVAAIRSGDSTGTLMRFVLASVAGAYYLVLFRTALAQRRRPRRRATSFSR